MHHLDQLAGVWKKILLSSLCKNFNLAGTLGFLPETKIYLNTRGEEAVNGWVPPSPFMLMQGQPFEDLEEFGVVFTLGTMPLIPLLPPLKSFTLLPEFQHQLHNRPSTGPLPSLHLTFLQSNRNSRPLTLSSVVGRMTTTAFAR